MDSEARPWERQKGEPNLWFDRFDGYYRPLGPERSLLGAYKAYYEAEKGRKSQAASAPTSWRRNAKKWRWESRAEDWDAYQRVLRQQEEVEARRKSREKRIALLNATLARSFEALQHLQPKDARWGDVTAAIRLVVQELRREYGDDRRALDLTVQEAGGQELSALRDMDEEELDMLIANLELAQGEGLAGRSNGTGAEDEEVER